MPVCFHPSVASNLLSFSFSQAGSQPPLQPSVSYCSMCCSPLTLPPACPLYRTCTTLWPAGCVLPRRVAAYFAHSRHSVTLCIEFDYVKNALFELQLNTKILLEKNNYSGSCELMKFIDIVCWDTLGSFFCFAFSPKEKNT